MKRLLEKLGLKSHRNEATFVCKCCGQRHEGPPLSYFFQAPECWSPEVKKEAGSQLQAEWCTVQGRHFFIKGNILLPVEGQSHSFGWTVWVSLSQDNFERARSLWSDPRRVEEPPYFGWLSSSIPGYPETLNLKTHVHTQAVGTRPRIELEATEHPLAVEQRKGITMDRVREIAHQMLHQR